MKPNKDKSPKLSGAGVRTAPCLQLQRVAAGVTRGRPAATQNTGDGSALLLRIIAALMGTVEEMKNERD